MRRVAQATPLADVSEKTWQAQVVELAKLMGWKRIYHTFNSQRSHSGFPDLVLVRERVVYAELKSEQGKVSDAQREWLNALHAAGAECHVWRPSDLNTVAEVLRSRQPTTKEESSMTTIQPPEMGDRVREITTGKEGVITGFCEYLWGCEQFLVYLAGETDKDGDPKSAWYDVSRLEVLERSVVSPIDYERRSSPTFSGADKAAPIR